MSGNRGMSSPSASVITAGPLGSTGITPLHGYYGPIRLPLASPPAILNLAEACGHEPRRGGSLRFLLFRSVRAIALDPGCPDASAHCRTRRQRTLAISERWGGTPLVEAFVGCAHKHCLQGSSVLPSWPCRAIGACRLHQQASSRQGPLAPRELPRFTATTGPSDFPSHHRRRFLISPRLAVTNRDAGDLSGSCSSARYVPSPLTPGAPTRRLTAERVGNGPLPSPRGGSVTNGVTRLSTGVHLALTARTFAVGGFSPVASAEPPTDTGHASPCRVAPSRLTAATCRVSDSHGGLLSSHEEEQTFLTHRRTRRDGGHGDSCFEAGEDVCGSRLPVFSSQDRVEERGDLRNEADSVTSVPP